MNGFLETMREAIRRAEFRLTPHPVFSKTHGAWLARQAESASLAKEAAALVAQGKGADPELVYALHARHAALGYGWIEGYASRLAEIIEDVRFEWGQRASNLESGIDDLTEFWYAPEGTALFGITQVIADASKAGDRRHFDKLENLTLAHLDFAEAAPILSADAREVRFACARCGVEIAKPLGSAGARDSCACGVEFVIPIPSLQRVHQATQAAREAAQGVTRCRICNQVVQTRKGPVERAGYCSKLCARDGEDRFREYIPDKAARRGNEAGFVCRCGAFVATGAADEGSLMPCPSCDLKLWVPPATLTDGRRAPPVACPKCAKKNRAELAQCQYCSTPLR